jgi:hypothetical protein
VSARPQSSKASNDFREVVTTWALAAVMLVILVLLASRNVDVSAESLVAATAHAYPIHAMPAHNEDPGLLGACDFDARDAEPAMPGAHARETRTRPDITPEGSDESDEC